MRTMRIVLGLLSSLPFLCLGTYRLWNWLQLRSGQMFYAESESVLLGNYLWGAVVPLAMGGFLVFCVIWSKKEYKPRVRMKILFPAMLLFIGGAALWGPCILNLPVVKADTQALNQLLEISYALDAWGGKHGRLPTNQSELEAATARIDLRSPFGRGKTSIPYRLVYVGGASEPALPEPPPEEPGVLYVAVRPDLKWYWLTVTVLPKPVAPRADWLQETDEWFHFPLHMWRYPCLQCTGNPLVYPVREAEPGRKGSSGG